MITNTLPTTELEMNTCAAYGVIEHWLIIVHVSLFVWSY